MLVARRDLFGHPTPWAALLIVLVIPAGGCQPQGAGSIKVGSPTQWHKEPEAPSPRSKPRKAGLRSPHEKPADQAPFRSIRDQMRERDTGTR
jgi:hypothetical protein